MTSDKEFLAAHDFDMDVPYDGRNPDWLDEEWAVVHQKLDSFLRSLYKKSFTLDEMTKFTGIGRKAGLNYVRSRPDVVPALEGKDGRVERWTSLAEPFDATIEGALELVDIEMKYHDENRLQARADYYWTQTRAPKKRKRAFKSW